MGVRPAWRQQGQLVVQAEAGEDDTATPGVSVPARSGTPARSMVLDQAQPALEDLTAAGVLLRGTPAEVDQFKSELPELASGGRDVRVPRVAHRGVAGHVGEGVQDERRSDPGAVRASRAKTLAALCRSKLRAAAYS